MSLSQADLKRVLSLLDVPECTCELRPHRLCQCEGECDCPRSWGEPCEHVLALLDHIPPELLDTPLDLLAALLLSMDREAYRDNGAPAVAPRGLVSRKAQIAIYQLRAKGRFALFRDDDYWKRRDDEKRELKAATVSEGERAEKDDKGNVTGRRKVLGRERNGRAGKRQRLVCGPPQQRGGRIQ